MFDCHVHTSFSTDSKLLLEAVIEKATKNNLGLIITEHMDLCYPLEGKFVFDPKEYFKAYTKYRNDKLLLGIELGMRKECVEENRALSIDYPFDYIIGSVHLVDGEDIFQENYYKNRTKKEAFSKYFSSMLQCVKEHDFIDSLGHIDYVSRYASYNDSEIYYNDFCDEIDEVLKVVIYKEKSIELNTRRFNNKNAIENLIKIYKRYYELGGRTVTIGSDAHNVDTIGSNFELARDVVDNCKLKIVYYKERKLNYL